jgi:two-component system, OmpR family, response regulator
VIKVLLVEDDPDLRDITTYVLRRERFVVVEARDGIEALRLWSLERPDLIVLDLGLPGVDGFDVLGHIRAQDKTPVLVLSGRTGGEDVLRTFSLGSDDFLAKPFEFRELTARIRAILRRADGPSDDSLDQPIDLDGLHLDPETNEVTWLEEPLRLTRTEFRILYVLASNAGHVVSASRLYTYVWGAEGADANALRSHISHIRRKLGSGGDTSAGSISAVPSVGYVFRGAAHEGDPPPIGAARLSAP